MDLDLDKRLIKEIKTHPVLYDSNHSMYKDVDHKHQVWVQISRKLIDGEDETTSVAALKVRWKSLRDAYVKERNYDIAKTCGMKMKNKKPWRLKNQMEFLAPYIQNRKEIDVTKAHDKSSRTTRSRKVGVVTKEKSSPLPNKNDSKTDIPLEENNENGESGKNMFNQTVPKENKHRLIEIDSFFRGIADAVKGLSSKNQIMVQRDVTEVVMNYKLRELEEENTVANS